jgi:hypothetical protein
MLTQKQADDLRERADYWRTNPDKFVEDVFGVTLEDWQGKVLRALAVEDRIAVKSGHGVGKTACESWIIFWFVILHNDVKIPCTAPTASQLKEILWSELGKWHRKMLPELKGMIEVTSEHVRIKNDDSRFAVARTARKENPEAFQGFHATNLLFIVDEASGVEDIIFEVGQGALSTKGAKLLMCGNPNRRSGYFFRAFYGANSDDWFKITVSSTEVERCDIKFIEGIIKEYGEDSDVYRVRVLGQFPNSDVNSLIPADVVERARKGEGAISQRGQPIIFGVDPAWGGGDRTCVVMRTGRVITKMMDFKPTNPEEHLVELADYIAHQASIYKPDLINIDVGGVGAGVYDILHRYRVQNIRKVKFGGAASGAKGLFKNKRAQIWGLFREWLCDEPVKIPDEDDFCNDLTEIQAVPTIDGSLQLESKEVMKKRGVRSPDWGDACACTFAEPVNWLNAYEREKYDTGGDTYEGYESLT